MPGPFSDLDRPPLDRAALRRALLGPDSLWRDLQVVATSASTNADLAAAARAGAAEGQVLVAEAQTAGRGRLDRSWTTPPRAGLTFSVLLRPPFPTAAWGWLPLLSGLAVAAALRPMTGLDVAVKWPNDVVVGDGKLGGLLTEVVGPAVVVGVGLNVSLREAERPVPAATSLAIEGSDVVDRDPVLRAVLRELERRYVDLCRAGGDADAHGLRAAYREVCSTVGRAVRVELPGGRAVEGTAADVDAAGRLVVDTAAGPTAVGAGDVVHVR